MDNKKRALASEAARDYEFCVLYNHKVISGGNTEEDRARYASLREWYVSLSRAQIQKFNKELY